MTATVPTLTEEQITDWNTHFKSMAQCGEITMEQWDELRTLCVMALASRSGGVVVPREPTKEMQDAGVAEWIRLPMSVRGTSGDLVTAIYKAMLASGGKG